MIGVLKAIATMGDIGDVMEFTNPEVAQSLIDGCANLDVIRF